MPEESLRYAEQDASISLREGLDEYYARNPGLLDPGALDTEGAELFRAHDAGHVVFGCDTSIRGETLIDTWTMAATAIGLRGYLAYLKQPDVNKIFAETGYGKIAAESMRVLPDILRVLARSRRLSEKWPWQDWERFLDRPLGELRRDFGIRVV